MEFGKVVNKICRAYEMWDSILNQKSDIIRCIQVWNFVADELNLHRNALNDFKQEIVEYYKTAIK